MRLTFGEVVEPKQRQVYSEVTGMISKARSEDGLPNSLDNGQTDLLKDLILSDQLKPQREVFSEVVKAYVKGEIDSVYPEYQVVNNRRTILDKVNSIKKALPAEERPGFVKRMFEFFLAKKDEMDKKAKEVLKNMFGGKENQNLTAKERQAKQDAASVMDYVRKVLRLDVNEHNVDVEEEDGGGGKNPDKKNGTLEFLQKELKTNYFSKEDLEKMLEFIGKLKFTIHKSVREKVSPSIFPDNDLAISNVDGLHDLPSILPSQVVYDEIPGMFEYRLYKKELFKKQYLARRKRKQVMYALLDVSGSMQHVQQTSLSLMIALMSHYVERGDKFILALFNCGIVRKFVIQDKYEIKAMIEEFYNKNLFGGGTAITEAMQTAIHDIKESEKNKEIWLSDADILLVTDGEDSVNVQAVNKGLEGGKIGVHSVVFNRNHEQIREISKSYVRVNGDDSDMEENALKMVRIV